MTSPNAEPVHPSFLGHSDRELERLSSQARLIDPITRGFFRDAGIGPGLRVLDVGTGAGDSLIRASVTHHDHVVCGSVRPPQKGCPR